MAGRSSGTYDGPDSGNGLPIGPATSFGLRPSPGSRREAANLAFVQHDTLANRLTNFVIGGKLVVNCRAPQRAPGSCCRLGHTEVHMQTSICRGCCSNSSNALPARPRAAPAVHVPLDMARPSGGPWRFWGLGSAGSSISRGRSGGAARPCQRESRRSKPVTGTWHPVRRSAAKRGLRDQIHVVPREHRGDPRGGLRRRRRATIAQSPKMTPIRR